MEQNFCVRRLKSVGDKGGGLESSLETQEPGRFLGLL